MQSFRNYLAVTLAILALSFVTLNAQSFSSGVPETGVEQEVKRKILKLPYYEVFDHISFTVEGDTVTLSGKVRNGINKSNAAGAVKRVAGISNVVNNIEILPPSSFDDSIRRNLYRTLSRSGGLSRYLWTVNPSVRLIVDRGHITLEGYVANTGDYNTMNILANGVSGVFSVTNNLVVDNGRAR